MNIFGKRINLRAIEPADLPSFKLWANDPEIQRLLGGFQFPTSDADHRSWLESLNCSSLNQRFAIESESCVLIGSANLVSIDWKNRTAFHGMMLTESARGKGYGMDTIMGLMRFAFDELGLEHLDTDIIEYNEASLQTYTERCGWEVQGVKPNWYFREGRRWNKIIVGISANEYRAHAASLGYWENKKF
ncbi:MAG: GNAT family protein [Emcibacteraceae bacterium]|nr:GNAT family protein [Emcibacteraceae bacterium]